MRLACSGLYAITKYGYPPSIPDTFLALEDMARLGFRYVELEGVREENLRAVWSERHALRRHAEGLGLKIINFCPVLPDLVDLDPSVRAYALELYKLAVETATDFGCESIQTDSFTGPLVFEGGRPYGEAIRFGLRLKMHVDPAFEWRVLWRVLIDTMRFCARAAADAGLRFCLEPRMGELISNTDAFLRLADALGENNFGILLDTGHQHAQKEILPLSVEKLGRRVVYVHLADNDGMTNEHRPIGDGTIDWEGLLRALAKHGFDGYLGLDIGNVEDIDGAVAESRKAMYAIISRLDDGIELEG